MDKTSYRVLTLTVSCLLFLSTTAQEVSAWPCTSCPGCLTCRPTGCECLAECCCDGRTCSGCCVCSGCSCVGGSCPACKSCVDCSCECTSECCEDSDCGPPGCWNCVNCECESQCNPDNCQTCVDGSCQVCGGDPNQVCCDGTCCDKVWTKETTDPIDLPCPSCDNVMWGCIGTSKTVPSYEECLNVGVGQGEHCQCNETVQMVGYVYYCGENWDISMMTWCLLQGSWCVAECYLFMDPAGCANCLMEFSVGCCPSGCGVCDFVESCDPYDPLEIYAPVFTGFDC